MLEIPISITVAIILGQLPIYQYILKKSFGDRIKKFLEDCKKTIESDINDMVNEMKKIKEAEDKAMYFLEKSINWNMALGVRESYYDLLKDLRSKYKLIAFLLVIQVFANIYPEYVINPWAETPVNLFAVGFFAFIIVLFILGKQTYEWFKLNEILTKRELGATYEEIFESFEKEDT